MTCHRYLFAGLAAASGLAAVIYHGDSHASELMVEPVQACIIARDLELTAANRERVAQCLGWQADQASPLCRGAYKPIEITPLSDDEIRIMANNVSFYREGQRSELSGNVEVQQTGRVVNAQTAYVYRDAKTNQIRQIELLGAVKYLEADRLMIARKATINPQDKSGRVEDVLYRFNSQRHAALLPSWGRAAAIERFANKDYLLERATYTTCQPQNDAWHIGAKSIKLDNANSTGVARNAKLYIRKVPILYTPYLSFPTSKERKSGFLLPVVGSSNVGGFDLALPYYWNIAPNYDATITPHLYTNRGLMTEGQFRYLSPHSYSTIQGRFLGHDRAYRHFLQDNVLQYPEFRGKSSDRWSVGVNNSTSITQNLHLGVNFSQVSDDYFLEDFSTNFAIMTSRQLLRQADLSYTTDHWLFRGMAQSYQTLHPINQTPVAEVYQRLPQLLAAGSYEDLPFNANFSLLGQYDNFIWPVESLRVPEGPRFHLNPILSLPQLKPWGFFTPSIQLVENYYDLRDRANSYRADYNRVIPRYSVDSGLYFERSTAGFTQTLEPRLFYLNVPYHNQTPVPVFDSGYMIFNADQLFRTNRFSGFDRIGDANQLSYALSSRWLSHQGGEKASFTLGQIRYFADRKVLLCQNPDGSCEENPLTLGFLSTSAKYSPVVGRALYHFNTSWVVTGDYAWDPATHATNNGHVNFHYEPEPNKIIVAGYSYLVNGDITRVAYTNAEDNPLNQITFSYAWPFSAKWSSLGGYNYNISKGYEMMSFLGVQYDNCCWALRLIGGRAFQSLDTSARPHYNNNVYLQILLKGLGTVGYSDPASRIRTFIPSYRDQFHR